MQIIEKNVYKRASLNSPYSIIHKGTKNSQKLFFKCISPSLSPFARCLSRSLLAAFQLHNSLMEFIVSRLFPRFFIFSAAGTQMLVIIGEWIMEVLMQNYVHIWSLVRCTYMLLWDLFNKEIERNMPKVKIQGIYLNSITRR